MAHRKKYSVLFFLTHKRNLPILLTTKASSINNPMETKYCMNCSEGLGEKKDG